MPACPTWFAELTQVSRVPSSWSWAAATAKPSAWDWGNCSAAHSTFVKPAEPWSAILGAAPAHLLTTFSSRGTSKHEHRRTDSTPAPADQAALHLALQDEQLIQRMRRPREAAEALQALLEKQARQRAEGRGPHPRGPGWRLCCSGSCAGASAPPLHCLHLWTTCVQKLWVLHSSRLVAVRWCGSRGSRAAGGQASTDTRPRHVILGRGNAHQRLQSIETPYRRSAAMEKRLASSLMSTGQSIREPYLRESPPAEP